MASGDARDQLLQAFVDGGPGVALFHGLAGLLAELSGLLGLAEELLDFADEVGVRVGDEDLFAVDGVDAFEGFGG
jgi:hypothetical protein